MPEILLRALRKTSPYSTSTLPVIVNMDVARVAAPVVFVVEAEQVTELVKRDYLPAGPGIDAPVREVGTTLGDVLGA
jgi:hypothetical protein